MKSREQLIEKITKLLALSDEDRNPSAHERERALSQAHAMMVKHSLTLADVEDHEFKDAIGAMGEQVNPRTVRAGWADTILSVIANLNGCECFYHPSVKNSTYTVTGFEADRMATIALVEYLNHSISSEAYSAYKAAKIEAKMFDGRPPNPRSFKNSFGVGAMQEIINRVKIMKTADKRLAQSDSKMMTVVNRTAAALRESTAYQNANHDLDSAPSVTAARDRTGYTQGKAFGRGVSLGQRKASSALLG